MKQRLIRFLCCAATVLLLSPAMAMARQPVEEKEIVDGRLEGYARGVTLPSESSALTWLLLVFLAGICVSVMFKNAKRTHLD